MPLQINPAKFVIELTNIDFARDKAAAKERLGLIHSSRATASSLLSEIKRIGRTGGDGRLPYEERSSSNHSFIKSYRDIVTYGIRIAMYTGKLSSPAPKLWSNGTPGLAIMMGTVWLSLKVDQSSIILSTNAIMCGTIHRPKFFHNW